MKKSELKNIIKEELLKESSSSFKLTRAFISAMENMADEYMDWEHEEDPDAKGIKNAKIDILNKVLKELNIESNFQDNITIK